MPVISKEVNKRGDFMIQNGKIGHGLKVKRASKKQFIKALEASGGNIDDACNLCGLSKGTFYRYYRYTPEIEKALSEQRKIGFESVTEVLYKLCLKGDTKAIALYLKYNPVAKANSWVESQTLVVKDEKPLTDEEKEALKKELFG